MQSVSMIYFVLCRCFFISKHAPTFLCVLHYYQSGGRLYRPDDIPEDIFLTEIPFYQLGDQVSGQSPLQLVMIDASIFSLL